MQPDNNRRQIQLTNKRKWARQQLPLRLRYRGRGFNSTRYSTLQPTDINIINHRFIYKVSTWKALIAFKYQLKSCKNINFGFLTNKGNVYKLVSILMRVFSKLYKCKGHNLKQASYQDFN